MIKKSIRFTKPAQCFIGLIAVGFVFSIALFVYAITGFDFWICEQI